MQIESINRFGLVDPFVVNTAPHCKNIIIGGNFRFHVVKELGFKDVPVVCISIADEQKEKGLNLRLPNRNQGFTTKHKFFSKRDTAMVGTSDKLFGLNRMIPAVTNK